MKYHKEQTEIGLELRLFKYNNFKQFLTVSTYFFFALAGIKQLEFVKYFCTAAIQTTIIRTVFIYRYISIGTA
jgi:hypothetical protein